MNEHCCTTSLAVDDAANKSIEDALDEALKEGFPASDPVAINIEHPPKAKQETC